MKKLIHHLDENDFEPQVWQKAQIKNNSGYLDQEYETTHEFPTIPDYHFRVEDDQTILDLQKISLNDPNLQPLNFQKASSKFHDKLQGLLQSINNVPTKTEASKSLQNVERHGFYSLEGEYDHQAAIKQAFNRLQVVEIEDKLRKLELNDKKPKFIKKAKGDQKMMSEGAAPVSKLSKQLNRLSINEEDL